MNELAPSTDRMTVAIVSRNYLVRLGLQTVLNDQPHLQFVGEASSIPEAEELIAREKPQALLIEMGPETDITELVRKVKTSTPAVRIIALIGLEDKHCTLGALSSGIDAIVLNIQPTVVLLATIDYVRRLRAETVLLEGSGPRQPERCLTNDDRNGAEAVLQKIPDASLTEREQEIIALVGQALSNKDIADRLCISSTTVRHHLTSIFDKLGVTNRQKLLLRAHQHGLVEFRAIA